MVRKKEYTWYGWSRAMSFNAVYILVVGARGMGKTFGLLLFLFKKAIKNKRQFMMVRRVQEEIDLLKDTFFDEISEHFPDYHFEVRKDWGYWATAESVDDEDRVWTPLVRFVALSGAQKLKGTSFPKIDDIFYDEFILEPGLSKYLPSEVKTILGLYSTVDRGNDRVKFYMCANSVSIMCPVFLHWNIDPDGGEEWVKRDNGAVIAHFPDSKEYKAEFFQSRFGQIVEGTEFGDYAFNAEFADGNDNLIKVKDSTARYQYTLEHEKGMHSVWYSSKSRQYYVQKKLPKKQTVFTLLFDKMEDGKIRLPKNNKTFTYLRGAFNTGRVKFDHASSREALRQLFDR